MKELNKPTIAFIEELKQDPEVTGIILFGSWARGNNRPDSDVDLIVLKTSGFKRVVEKRNDQIFEITYTTPASALDFWKSKKDDAADLWAVAEILFDRDGTISNLKTQISEVLAKGKTAINPEEIQQLKFDAEDQIHYAEQAYKADPVTATLILNDKISNLSGKFFDLRQLWTPAPKQRLAKIKEIEPRLFSLIEKFYLASEFDIKISLAKDISQLVFSEI